MANWRVPGLLLLLLLQLAVCSLPDNWSKHTHQGKEYYYNKATGQSQWVKPEDVGKSKTSIGTLDTNHNTASYMHYQSQPSNVAVNRTPSITFSGRKLVNKSSRPSTNTNDGDSNIDELKIVIANMTHEKQALLGELNAFNSSITYMTSTIGTLQSNITMILAGVDELEDQLVSNNEKLDAEISQNNLLLQKLNATQNLYLQLCENYDRLEKNYTESSMSLGSSNRELTAAYEEIEKLEDDLRQVSMPTVKKMKTHTNVFSRMWGYALTMMNNNNDYSLIEKQDNKIHELSSLIDLLRENITAMTDALLSKEDLIIELSDQLDENEEESNHRRRAYAELKAGISQLQEENAELQDGIDDRDHAVVDMAATIVQLNTTIYEKDKIYSSKLHSLHSRINDVIIDGQKDSAAQLSLISQISQQLIEKDNRIDYLTSDREEKDNMIEYLTSDFKLLQSVSVGYQSELEELKQKHYNLTVSYDRLVSSSASDDQSSATIVTDRASYPDNSSSDDNNSDDNKDKDKIFGLFDV